MTDWMKHAPATVAISLLIVGCSSDLRAYESLSGNILRLDVLSAEQVSPEQVKISVCYEIPSEADWVLSRLFGDVTLSDTLGSAVMDYFELLALSDSPFRRCDRLFFSRPGGFPPGEYTLEITRLAATIPAEPDWAALLSTLEVAAPGLVIEPLPGETGPSFALIATPPGMTDALASDLVVGLSEPVLLGPWSIPVQIEQ